MRVDGARATGATRSTRAARAKSSDFSLEPASVEAETQAAPISGATGVGSVDAILALQGVGADDTPRRQAASRAFDMLDALDDMRLSLLEGRADPAALQRLAASTARARTQTDEAGLEDVLDAVDVRAAVELAKAEMSKRG